MAVGAFVAALLETSVLSELTLGGIKPDLVLVVAVVVAMVIGFENALVWAVVGGLLIDILTGRPLGATALGLLLVAGMASLTGRVTGGPRIVTVSTVTFALALFFQALQAAILTVTAGVSPGPLPVQTFLFIALFDAVVAAFVLLALRPFLRRFGREERLEW